MWEAEEEVKGEERKEGEEIERVNGYQKIQSDKMKKIKIKEAVS